MKKLVFKQLAYLFSVCMIVFTGMGVYQAEAQNTPTFDQLKQTFEEGQIFHAEFTHRYEDSFTGETEQNEGVIWIGKEQYRIEGLDQIMIVDGEISRVYDGAKNRVIVSDYVEEEDDFAPSRMLQGVDDSYSVSETSENGKTKVVLHSDDPFSIFESVTILLDANGYPEEIRAIDQAENQLITRFYSGSFIELTDDLFDLEIPAEAELIDLRYNSQ